MGRGPEPAAASQAAAVARLLRARVEQSDGHWLEVAGVSMAPTIEEPARVLLHAADAPRSGEVWAFVADDTSVITHRFVRRLPDGTLRFQGDANRHHDPPVAPDRLIGRVERAADARGERAVGRERARAWAAAVRFGLWRRSVAIRARLPGRPSTPRHGFRRGG